MSKHSSNVAVPLAAFPDVEVISRPVIRTEEEARRYTSMLVALGFDRCPASRVAKAVGKGESTLLSYRHPLTLGLRAHDLLLAPRPFALTVSRGLVAQIEGSVCGAPSRSALALMLADVVRVCATALKEDPNELSDELLQQRLREMDTAAADLEQVRRGYEETARRRGLLRGQRAHIEKGAQ